MIKCLEKAVLAIVGIVLGIVIAPFMFALLTLGLLIMWIGVGILCLIMPFYFGVAAMEEVE